MAATHGQQNYQPHDPVEGEGLMSRTASDFETFEVLYGCRRLARSVEFHDAIQRVGFSRIRPVGLPALAATTFHSRVSFGAASLAGDRRRTRRSGRNPHLQRQDLPSSLDHRQHDHQRRASSHWDVWLRLHSVKVFIVRVLLILGIEIPIRPSDELPSGRDQCGSGVSLQAIATRFCPVLLVLLRYLL